MVLNLLEVNWNIIRFSCRVLSTVNCKLNAFLIQISRVKSYQSGCQDWEFFWNLKGSEINFHIHIKSMTHYCTARMPYVRAHAFYMRFKSRLIWLKLFVHFHSRNGNLEGVQTTMMMIIFRFMRNSQFKIMAFLSKQMSTIWINCVSSTFWESFNFQFTLTRRSDSVFCFLISVLQFSRPTLFSARIPI